MRRYFTLVEMLVVIGIIGILAALLVPALSRARASAKAVTCLNNYKQISNAIYNYTADHEDKLPISSYALPTNPKYSGSMSLLDFLGWLDSNYIHSFNITKVKDNTATVDKKSGGEVWLCEEFMALLAVAQGVEKNRCGFFLGNTSNSHYDMDLFLRAKGAARASSWRKLGSLKLPAPYPYIAMVTEMSVGSWHMGGAEAQKPYSVIPQPHNNSFTVAWLDGHVTQESAPKGYYLNNFPTSENDKWVKSGD